MQQLQQHFELREKMEQFKSILLSSYYLHNLLLIFSESCGDSTHPLWFCTFDAISMCFLNKPALVSLHTKYISPDDETFGLLFAGAIGVHLCQYAKHHPNTDLL